MAPRAYHHHMYKHLYTHPISSTNALRAGQLDVMLKHSRKICTREMCSLADWPHFKREKEHG